MIPLDGKIISGETAVDEAAVTGEPIPKRQIYNGDILYLENPKQKWFYWK